MYQSFGSSVFISIPNVKCLFQYPGKKASNLKEHPEIPALLRVEIWLGLERDQDNWTARGKSEGEFVVYAETVSMVKQCDNDNI